MREAVTFEWTTEQRRLIQGRTRADLARKVKLAAEMVQRFKDSVPEFGAEVQRMAGPLVQDGNALLALDGRYKVQRLSYEAALKSLDVVNSRFDELEAFLRRQTVQAAIKKANRSIQQQRRGHRLAAQQAIDSALNSEQYADKLKQFVEQRLAHAKQAAELAQGVSGFGDNRDLPILERYLLVDFVRAYCEFNRERRQAIRQFVRTEGHQDIGGVIEFVITSIVRESLTQQALKPKAYAPAVSGPAVRWDTYESSAFEGLLKRIDQWKAAGVGPSGIESCLFTIEGVDFSLDATAARRNE